MRPHSTIERLPIDAYKKSYELGFPYVGGEWIHSMHVHTHEHTAHACPKYAAYTYELSGPLTSDERPLI